MDFRLGKEECRSLDTAFQREWLLTNGLGGFAMGTAGGANTRRYHGWLVAAVNPPAARMLLLGGVETWLSTSGAVVPLSANQYQGAVHPAGHLNLESFSAGDWVEWVWSIPKGRVRRRLGMTQGENTVTMELVNESDSPVVAHFRPLTAHRDYHGNFRWSESYPDRVELRHDETAVRHDGVTLRLFHPGMSRDPASGWHYRFEHKVEVERGLDPCDDLFFPVELSQHLDPGEAAVLIASDLESPTRFEFKPFGEESDVQERWVRRFFVQAPKRTTILAGYPWFTDWGRDSMISLPGVCLGLGSWEPGKKILRSYASQIRHGLIPNRFVEAGEEPESNTVDATLWFGNAVWEVWKGTRDPEFAQEALSWLMEIIEAHMSGTLHGIKMDPADGLITQGGPGLQLTWMDAKIGDWVVTPRTGKPVEVNGLWLNLLRVGEELERATGAAPGSFVPLGLADKVQESFVKAYWRDSLGWLLDVADPDDGSLRPNQALALCLPFVDFPKAKAASALNAVREHLFTPRGLRTLAPFEASYQGRFEGPMRQRDSVYHQGTAWPWLLGPYAIAAHRWMGDPAHVADVLSLPSEMLEECGLGGIAEVYDGDEPQRPGGCPWQAWSLSCFLWAKNVIASSS